MTALPPNRPTSRASQPAATTTTTNMASSQQPPQPAAASPSAPSSSPSSSSSSAPADLPAIVKNDPARTGFDPQTKWWINYFKILSGQVTPEGKFHYREWRYRVHEERDCRSCEEMRDWAFAHSPTVRFLRDKVADLNGRLDADNVVCRRCPARLTEDGAVHGQSGGFSPDHGILLCANVLRDRKHLEDTLAHEMVHAWDALRYKVDWHGDKDLKHAACTEVRFLLLPIPPHTRAHICAPTHSPTHMRPRDNADEFPFPIYRSALPC